MKKILASIIAIFLAQAVNAQTGNNVSDTDNNLLKAALKGWHIRLSAGYNIGGTAPLPLPREIRGIESYNPGLNFAIEGTVEKNFKNSPWGIRWGIRFETKGMTTKAETKNYHMEAWNTDGSGQVFYQYGEDELKCVSLKGVHLKSAGRSHERSGASQHLVSFATVTPMPTYTPDLDGSQVFVMASPTLTPRQTVTSD